MSDKSYRVIDHPDGTFDFVEMTPEEVAAARVEAEAENAARIAAKGHDCWEHPSHRPFRTPRGGLQDAYYCALCGDLLQVG